MRGGTGRNRAGLLAGLLAVLVSMAALSALPASAQQDLSGRAILSYQLFEQDELLSRGFHQQYDLGWERQLTDPFRFRLSFRGEGNNGSAELGDITSKNSYRQLQPQARFDYTLPKIQLSGQYDLIKTTAGYDTTEGSRQLQRITGALNWNPESLPFFSLQAEQRSYRDALSGVDRKENFFAETLGYAWNGLSLSQIGRYTTYDAAENGFSRTTYDLQGLVKYDGSFFEGRGTASATALFGVTHLEELAQSRSAVSAPNRVPVFASSYVYDDTPAESRDRPLVPLPALIDGNLVRSAGVSVGPTGTSFQNLGIDVGRYIALDTFRVHVRDAEEKLIPYGGLVRWDVWTSGDAVNWSPVPGGARTAYLRSAGVYEVAFPSATSRYFKIVSFGTNSTDTLVTEVEAFFHSALAANETRTTDTQMLSGNVSLTGKPADWAVLSYYANVNDYRTTQQNAPELSNNDLDQVVSLELIPSKVLDVVVRYENRSVATSGYDQTYSGLWGIVTATFNPNLITSLEASRTDDRNTFEAATDTLRFHAFARFLPSLDLTLDVGVARGKYTGELPDSRQTFLNAVSYVQLTDSLKLTLNANFQRTTYEGKEAILPGLPGLIGLPPARNDRWYGELYYRPSPQLLLSGRLGYVTGSVVSGVTKALRVEWYPFVRGTLGIGTVLDEDVESNGSFRRFRRVQILPRWMINRHATIDVNFNWLSMRDELPGRDLALESKARLVYVNLTLTL